MLKVLLLLVAAKNPLSAQERDRVKHLCALEGLDQIQVKNTGYWGSDSTGEGLASQVKASRSPGIDLNVFAHLADLSTCPLAEKLNQLAGIDSSTGCELEKDRCYPRALDDKFAEAFEALPDRASKKVVLQLKRGEKLIVSQKLKSLTDLRLSGPNPFVDKIRERKPGEAVDLKALSGLGNLKSLGVDALSLTGLSPLSTLTTLERFDAYEVRLHSPLTLEFIKSLPALKWLQVTLIGEPSKVDLSALVDNQTIDMLSLGGFAPGSCEPVKAMKALRHFILRADGPLKDCKSLKRAGLTTDMTGMLPGGGIDWPGPPGKSIYP